MNLLYGIILPLIGYIATTLGNSQDDINCLFIYREYQPDDHFRSFIPYFVETPQRPETAHVLVTLTILRHTLPQNETSLLRTQQRLGSNCVVIFLFLVDFKSQIYQNLQHDQKAIFSNYYNSPESVFVIRIHQHILIPWGKSPSSAYLSLSSSPNYADYFVLKDAYVGGTYGIIPPKIPIWDIFQRKWRPSLALHHSMLLAVNAFDIKCIPRADLYRIEMDIFHTPCNDNSEFLHLLSSHFNISMGYDVSPETFWKSPFNTIHVNLAFVSIPESLKRVPRMYSAYQRHILYCRAVTKFESTWTVWLTPYDYHCWMGVCVTVLLPIVWMLQFNLNK
ncbi:hypothetical protein Fcan01_25852 [Folsomia candida]|uniref:Uncharacterized protein n=1 Tax=Folsomia candida TaxID=158441 RepID=A0A226D269_FOLCA|nr:hypothetical protein Fcan01_25852 [Folsomia candida]